MNLAHYGIDKSLTNRKILFAEISWLDLFKEGTHSFAFNKTSITSAVLFKNQTASA